jgi:hypothetical protein
MQFSEANGLWQPVPQWVTFLVGFGFAWRSCEPLARRIGLVSMPCDSAAAGLIALGAMRRRLGLSDANDTVSHFRRIEALAMKRSGNFFLRNEKLKGRFVVERKDGNGVVWVRQEPSTTKFRTVIMPTDANNWQFDGEAPIEAVAGHPVPSGDFYAELVDGANELLTPNLGLSDSGICLAGRATGESDSQRTLAAIRFQRDGRVADLSHLLAVQAWSPGMISRVTFFNTRTGRQDRSTAPPQLVVADGDTAFLRAIETEHFQQSEVVGVIHRTMERSRLESVGSKMSDLRQWYSSDVELPLTHSAPHGIALTILRRN